MNWRLADGRGDGCYVPDVDGNGQGVPYHFKDGNGFGTGEGTEGTGNGDFTRSSLRGNSGSQDPITS